jgi:superfamily I DNA/RNA helicase
MRSDRPKLDTIIQKDFQKFLNKLSRRGGIADLVYKQVISALFHWERNEDAELPLTNHGESRVSHVVKYDLRGAYRLIVYEHAGKRIPLMVGDHEDAERWLKNNRGRDFTTDTKSKRVEYTIATTDRDATNAATTDVEAVPSARGPVLDRLPQDLIVSLMLSEGTLATLNAFATFEEVEDGRIWTLIQGLTFPTDGHRQVLIQAVALIASGDTDKAIATITLFLGNATTATEKPDEFVTAIDCGENSDKLIKLSDISTEELDRINKTDGFTDWMLYLHPDQRRLVDHDYNGPSRLLGVSGSGKTTVLVHRANALATKYSHDQVLVLTINPALSQLIRHLLNCLCTNSVRARIQVSTIYEYCYHAIKIISPQNRIEKLDPRSGEDLEACWKDFLDKRHASQNILKVTNVLEEREANINSAGYILDELIWIRSGFGRNERKNYLTSERTGRGIALPKFDGKVKQNLGDKEFPPDTRPRLLRLLDDYEEYMKDGGLMDDDGVSLEAFSIKHRIKAHPSLRARCVLVDEVQDCSTVELAVISEIPTEAENGLFLTGDPVQKVYAKQQDLILAGLDIRGRSTRMVLNYRNSRQILEAAYSIIKFYREIAPIPPDEVLEPEYAAKEGPRPKLYECASREEQIRLVTLYLGWMSPDEHDGVCICSASEESLREFSSVLLQQGLLVYRIHGGRSTSNPVISRGIKLCLMRDVKGYEFQYLFLVDLIDGVVMPNGMPWEERWRVAFLVYVAMTRARKELIMSFINNRSYFLGPLQDTAEDLMASDVLSGA